MHLFVGWLACTVTDSSETTVSSTEQEQINPAAVDNSPSGLQELPPTHDAKKITATLNAISAGEVLFTQFKGCAITDSIEGDAPNGQFLYAWNEAMTVGLVLSIHHLTIKELPVDTVKNLSIKERDAFVMIEVGERVDSNFCVSSLTQIPIATVLESQTGTVQIKRTELGIEANIGTILFRDQYSKQEVSFDGLTIPAQKLDRPTDL